VTAATPGLARHAAELAALRDWGTAARQARQQAAAPVRAPKNTGEMFSLELARALAKGQQ
jgi:hypothetical protein